MRQWERKGRLTEDGTLRLADNSEHLPNARTVMRLFPKVTPEDAAEVAAIIRYGRSPAKIPPTL